MLARLKNKRGFTLVELMIVVAIVGVLAALAIYGVRKYLTNAKTTEARNGVGQMAKDAETAYNKESMSGQVLDFNQEVGSVHRLCTGATAVPQSGIPKQEKVQPAPSEWNTGSDSAGWKCLKFSIDAPILYRYNYVQTGSPSTGSFTAIAEGDLDGDDATSMFSMIGAVAVDSTDGSIGLQISPAIIENDPEE